MNSLQQYFFLFWFKQELDDETKIQKLIPSVSWKKNFFFFIFHKTNKDRKFIRIK